jgi:Rrf2 family cysteine metabolism transcriptional repressor
MKVSVKLEYACRVMVHLARLHPSGTLAHIGTLSEAEGIAPNYLVQSLTSLRESGLIASRRGKQGGYVLAAAPDAITLRAVMEAVEGEILEFSEVPAGDCGEPVRRALEGLRSLFLERAESITLDQLAPRSGDAMYFI